MNRQMNLPALQRIAMEFEKENDIMDQRQEMMDDAIDDVTGLEDEEEGEEVVNQVLDEIGIDLGQAVRDVLHCFSKNTLTEFRWVRHPVVFKRRQSQRDELRKPWVVVTPVMTISRLAWIAYADEDDINGLKLIIGTTDCCGVEAFLRCCFRDLA